ncbi:MAG: hypothetical protein JWR17_862 [Pseudomonas sp.]|uniref:glucosyltransferase domain-containing protein n=1 Tax=Pseudomonas sp. TaxID=306 RepID=UPI002633DD45|nr:glucosyltransferase domain-containing protein [Pseudomonas sp.]MDB6048116.1 hypothetical protein [Pseudomonas sp.]
MVDLLKVELSQNKMMAFFVMAVFIFAFPLILADSFYLDDNWRAQLAGMEWKEDGRILAAWLYQGLSFTQGAPNIFPLPLLISIVAMSFALRALTNHYFLKPTVVSCLVVLPLWYSPFFLQNLSYQYDGPAMALGVMAVIYAITFRHASLIVRTGVSALCIAIGLSLYQMVINIYLGLCCVELIRTANECKEPRTSFIVLRDRLLQFLLAVAFYWLTAYQFITHERTGLRELNNGWTEKLSADLLLAAQRVALLYNDGNAWLCWSLLIIAFTGFGLVIYRVLRVRANILHRTVLVGLCLFAIALVLVSIPGLALIFSYYNNGARVMMGASSALVLIFYLNYQALTAVHTRLGGLLIIPVIAMLSFSYAYGRVMYLQKELSTSIAQSVTYDVISNKDLRGVEKYYMVNNPTHGWLVGADGAFKLMPALKYVFYAKFLLLPEMLPRSTGITNVFSFDDDGRSENVLKGIFTRVVPLVDNKFYSIYVDGVDAYILMKTPSVDDVYFKTMHKTER